MPIVYFLRYKNQTYIGATKNILKRLRQHRGIIKGGAKYTSRWDNVHIVGVVSGFTSWNQALSYEWHAKRKKGPRMSTPPSLPRRSQRFAGTIYHEKFKYTNLTIHWYKPNTCENVFLLKFPKG